jgi:hypothetical protein
MVNGYIEKSLQLVRVQVYRNDSVSAGARYNIGNKFGCNWDPAFILSVLPGVPEIWYNRRNAPGAGPPKTVKTNQKLHQILINRLARRLHDKAISAANIILQLDYLLTIGKALYPDPSMRNIQITANRLGQLRIAAAGKHLQIIVQKHLPSLSAQN